MRRGIALLLVLVVLSSCDVSAARRLLMAASGGGGSFTPPHPVYALTSAPHGGWTQTQGPRAVYLAGWTYLSFINGSDGHVEVSGYKDDGTTIAPISLHAAITSDTHDAPSLLVRDSDHKLMVWYSGHDAPHMYQRVSVNSLDSDPTLSGGFASETDLDSQLGGLAYTYPQVGQLGDGTIWLAYRDDSTLFYLAKSTSTDDGVTWAAQTLVFDRGLPYNSYWMVHYGATRVDFAISNGNGITDADISVLHVYWSGGSWYKTDGTLISTSPPFSGGDITLVYDGSTPHVSGWQMGMSIDGTGAPVILYQKLDAPNPTGHAYTAAYARWSGSAWVSHDITTWDDTGMSLIASSAFDEADPTIVWIAKPVAGVWQMFRYVTADNGVTWTGTQITSGVVDNVYPANVRDHGSIIGAIWMSGTYVATDNFDTGISGTP